MARKDMKTALGASVKDEEEAVRKRFDRAEAILGGDEPQKTQRLDRFDRVLRDSFTMPPQDYDRIGALRDRCLKDGIAVTKSEILRAGLIALQEMGDTELRMTINKLVKVKTGRPSDQ